MNLYIIDDPEAQRPKPRSRGDEPAALPDLQLDFFKTPLTRG